MGVSLTFICIVLYTLGAFITAVALGAMASVPGGTPMLRWPLRWAIVLAWPAFAVGVLLMGAAIDVAGVFRRNRGNP